MAKSIFSAPGKIVIAGEYAVLEGREALACSVDRSVHVIASEEKQSRISVDEKNGLLHYVRNDEHSPVSCVIDELKDRGLAIPDLDFEIDSSELYLSSLKLGFGSSAAVTVALTRALLAPHGYDLHDEIILEVALAAHRRFTRSGSGIDVATSFFCSLIRFRNVKDSALPQITCCEASPLMRDLILVHTGVAQATSAFLERVVLAKAQDPVLYEKAITGIENAAQSIIKLMTGREPLTNAFALLCDAVLEHNASMNALGMLANIDIISDAHRRIATLAQKHHGCAKPSGAGGGDLALCFIEARNRERFIEELIFVHKRAPIKYAFPT